jgi:hypothetical protein
MLLQPPQQGCWSELEEMPLATRLEKELQNEMISAKMSLESMRK